MVGVRAPRGVGAGQSSSESGSDWSKSKSGPDRSTSKCGMGSGSAGSKGLERVSDSLFEDGAIRHDGILEVSARIPLTRLVDGR